jgi:hypothetical protein
MIKKSVFLFFCFFSGVIVYAQNEQLFNLPPGAVLHPKANTSIDYSYKLNELSDETKPIENINFLKQFSQNEIEEMEKEFPEGYAYYKEAEKYFNKLSSRVINIFTVEELWYIYQFDLSLKEKLLKH